MDVAVLVSLFALGLLLWPLVEYGIHGFLSHRLRTPVSGLHWVHHVQPERVFTSALAWIPAIALLFFATSLALGAARAGALVSGLLLGFWRYEYVHWRMHFRMPRNPRERLLRAHHLAHHFRNSEAYHGVTTRFWDRVFGTLPKEHERDYAAVADAAPLAGPSNFGQLLPRR